MAKYFAILTEAGEAKMARALISNTMVPLTEMAVGDGGIDGGTDADVTPSIEQHALVRERLRRPLNRLVTDPKNPSIVIAEIYLPEDVGGWWIRELGLFDEDGELFAVANVPPSYKPILAEGSGRGQFYRMMLIHKAAGNIALQVDPSIVVATREYVDEQVTAVRTALTGANDERYATKESVEQLQGAVGEAHDLAVDALPRSGGEMTGPIDMTGPSNELRFTDNQQPLTIGRFRMVSSNGQLVFDRNTAADGSFASFSRLYWVDGKGNFVVPGALTAASLKTQSNVTLPAYNNDGRGFLEFGGDTVLWRMFMAGPNGNLMLNGYNADGTNKHQPFYVDYASGRLMLPLRPDFNGATPYDTSNLKDPLTAEGGMLAEGKGLIFGATYGSTPLRVGAAWGSSNLGGAYLEWNQTRTPALQIDAPSALGAYMGIRWTQWGSRHLAAIDCYAGGTDTSMPRISFHIGNRTLAWSFDENNITRWDGGNVWGTWNFDPGTKATKGATAQTNSVAEFGAIDISKGGNQTYDLPAPYVMCGLRNVGNTTIIYLRGTYLTQQ